MRLPVRAVETIFLSMVVLVAAVVAVPAQTFSTDPLNRAERNRIIAPGELQALDRIQGRRDFQRQQQQYREQDRPRVEPQRLKVPRLQQGCQQRLTRNRLVTTCF